MRETEGDRQTDRVSEHVPENGCTDKMFATLAWGTEFVLPSTHVNSQTDTCILVLGKWKWGQSSRMDTLWLSKRPCLKNTVKSNLEKTINVNLRAPHTHTQREAGREGGGEGGREGKRSSVHAIAWRREEGGAEAVFGQAIASNSSRWSRPCVTTGEKSN